MKKIFYILCIGLLALVSCNKSELDTVAMPEEGIAIRVKSLVDSLSDQALNKVIKPLHLLVFDENGKYIEKSTYDDLAAVTSKKLPLGNYTFAYVSNVDIDQIGGLKEGGDQNEVTVSLPNADSLGAGNIFTGQDTVVVGKDKESNAGLKRIVGRLDISVTGLGNKATLKSLFLKGSPKTVKLNGEGVGETLDMHISAKQNVENIYEGSVIAFPTMEEKAVLVLTITTDDGDKEYTVELKNKVESNKIHHITAKFNYQVTGSWDLTLDMVVKPWGETVTEEVILGGQLISGVNFVFNAYDQSLWDRNFILEMYLEKLEGQMYNNSYNLSKNDFTINENSALIVLEGLWLQGTYKINSLRLIDSLSGVYYTLPAERNVVLDSTAKIMIELPAMQSVTTAEKQALLDLRVALKAVDSHIFGTESDEIALWSQVELDENGHVVGIGYDELSYFLRDMQEEKKVSDAASASVATRSSGVRTWTLPESFKDLTYLKYFIPNTGENVQLAELPTYIKNMTSLEQLGISLANTILPELPNLKYLSIESDQLTIVPEHLAKMTNLVYLELMPVTEEKGAITSIEADFSALQNLLSISLMTSKQCVLPQTIWNCKGLRQIGLGGFQKIEITANLSELTQLKEVNLSSEDLLPADIEPIKDLPLKTLGMYSCFQFGKNGLPDWIGNMSTLEEVDFDSCGLVAIPASFDGLVNLRSMYMTANPDMKGQLPPALLRRYQNGELYVYVRDCGTFSPDGILLKVAPDYIEVAETGGTVQLQIESNSDWEIQLQYSNLKFDKISGKGDDVVTVTIPENTSEYEIAHSIEIVAGNHQVNVTVYQRGMHFNLSTDYLAFGVKGGIVVFNINTEEDISWTVSSPDSYMSFNKTSGTGNAEIEVNVSPNASQDWREGGIEVRYGNSGVKYIRVMQEGLIQ